MRLLNYIHRLPNLISLFLTRYIDVVICVFFLLWVLASVSYNFYYDSIYYPYALFIMHYTDMSVLSYVIVFSLYNKLQGFGKVTVIGWFFVLCVNTYQLHIGFTDKWYCIFWIGFIFLWMLIGYFYKIAKYYNELFNHKYYK